MENAREMLVEGDPGTRSGRPLRLYADGIFDMFHFGHAKALQQVKQAYPNVTMIVGCCNDEMTHKYKGQTVLREEERYESLRHCRWVDEVITDAPWVISDDFLEKHQIDYVCHDALPYNNTSGEGGDGDEETDVDIYARLKKAGKFYETKRTDGISTSELIIRIISKYDTFIRRNLERGYSPEEMNVPWAKGKKVEFDIAIDEAQNKVKEAITQVQESLVEVKNLFREWGEGADNIQHNFLEMFLLSL